jgi:lipoprotein-releasing system permease protein
MMSSDLHILIQPTSHLKAYEGGYFPEDNEVSLRLDAMVQKLGSQISGFWPVVSTEVILKSERKVTGIFLKGVSDARIDQLKAQVVELAEPRLLHRHEKNDSSIPLPGLFIGQELAYELGLIPGDQVTLVSPTETEGPVDGVPRLKRCLIEGIYHTGMPDQELHTAFTEEKTVQSFLKKSRVLSQWEISVKEFDQAPIIANQIRNAFPELKVQDWMQLNSHLFASLRLERLSMFVILTFIIIVASFNIVTTLTLMVLEKKKDISILKAIGARHGQVAAIFLAEGILIGMIGIGSGLGLGLGICSLLRRYEFITLPDIYYDRTLPVTFEIRYYLFVSLCALMIVLAACLYPSRRAARIHPIEGIRFG